MEAKSLKKSVLALQEKGFQVTMIKPDKLNQDFAVQVLYQGIYLVLLISAPSVGVGLLVGFTISLFQAITQIQEQTLTFVPKVISVLLVVAFTSPWVFSMIIDFTNTLWSAIPNMAR